MKRRLEIESLEGRQLMSASSVVQHFVRQAPADAGHVRAAQDPIDIEYNALGGARGFLGAPTMTEYICPDRVGHYRHYQGGSIYWSPSTGAHEIHGAIRAEYAKLGWERSFLGYPTTDEVNTREGHGRDNMFQGGTIIWSQRTGAHEIHGAIFQEYMKTGATAGILGYPLTDESTTPDGVGRYNLFGTSGGSGAVAGVYWTPQTGAHEVHGAIYQRWASMGWERGSVGYPTSDEMDTPEHSGRYNDFQHGAIGWTPSSGPIVIDKTSSYSGDRNVVDHDGFTYLHGEYEVLAPGNKTYNCIAWSLGITNQWVWPGDQVSDFDKLDGQYGYHRLSTLDYSLQPGIEKIALYADHGHCTHQSHQEADGSWTSKLGQQARIRHLTPAFVDGGGYGEVIAIYARRR